MFEEKLDTADFCLLFGWIEDREGEVRSWKIREKGPSIQGQNK